MVQDGKTTSPFASGSSKPPITDDHFLLPLFKDKYAPSKQLSTNTVHTELSHFLDHYEHLCQHYEVHSSREKCKGLAGYCIPKLAKTIKTFPSYVQGDFEGLIEDLHYFMEGEDDSYNFAKVDLFTKKWRKKPVGSLENFKRYHRKFLELVGRAIGSGLIDQKEYNRHFWGGIHRSLRKRIEDRLLVINPNLDVSVPVEMSNVIKAVANIFNRKRFDQHLLSKEEYESDTDTEGEVRKPSRVLSDSEESEDEDSEDDDIPRKRSARRKTSFPSLPKSFPRSEPPSSKKPARDEIAQLTEQLKDLKLFVMQKVPEFRNSRNPPQNQHQNSNPYYNPPPRNSSQYNRPTFNPPPQSNQRPPYGNQPPPSPKTQFTNTSYHNRSQRDVPPRMSQNQSAGPPQDPYCHGCGKYGHNLRYCTELNTLVNQGMIMRNHMGKITWPDGSFIIRDPDEPFILSINRTLKRSNVVRAEVNDIGTGEIYDYIGVEREESDASSDEQENLHWTSGTVADCYAVGADRNPRVSRDARRTVQFNTPSIPKRVQEFSKMRDTVHPGNQNLPIQNSRNLNSNQPRNITRLTPFDVNQHKFEGKFDHQFLPMDVDQHLPKEPGNEVAKVSTNQPRPSVPKTPNPGTIADKVSTDIIQEVLKKDVTVQLGQLLEISPNVRRNLQSAVKGQSVALRQTVDQKEPSGVDGKSFFGSNVWQPLSNKEDGSEVETRDDLLMVSARIGNIPLTGVIDSGYQANIINEKYARACGLPIQVGGLEKIKISGVNGGLAKCVGVIPEAAIYVTDSQLETTGKLLVIEDAAFKLLLGRPWGTRNKIGIREANEGTYLSFDSKGERYEINVSPSQKFRKQIREIGSVMYAQKIASPGDVDLSLSGLSLATIVPDSQEPNIPDDDEGTLTLPVNKNWSLSQTLREVEEGETSEEDFSEEEDVGNQHWKTPPPSPIYTQPTPEATNGKSIVIESELQESFIKLVQKGINQDEWQRFCKKEKQKLQRNQKKWKKWKRRRETESDDEEIVDKLGTNPLNHMEPLPPPNTPEPAQPPRKPPNQPKPPRESVFRTEGRSRRIRRETKKAQESEYWQRLKQRAYERDEKFTRNSVRTQNCTVPGQALASLGVICTTEGTGDDQSEAEEVVIETSPKEASLIDQEELITPLIDQMESLWNDKHESEEVQKQAKEPNIEEDLKSIEPRYHDWTSQDNQYKETTYWCGPSTVTRRDIGRPPIRNGHFI